MELRPLMFRPTENPIDELYKFATPIGKMKEPKEAIKFIEWMPALTKPEHAYYAMLLVRAKERREKFGYKGKEKALAKVIVPGYLRNPKLRLFLELRKLALLAEYSYELFVYERHEPGTNTVSEIWRYPPDIVGVLVNVNIHNWVRASIKAITEFIEGTWEVYSSGDYTRMTRLDDRVKSLAPTTSAKGVKSYFTIDIDDRKVADEVLERVKEYTGFVPARIITPRGMHILVSWHDIPRERREEFRLNLLRKLPTEYGNLVEWKKIPQEPLPGTEYKKPGFIVRFKPEEK